MKKVRMIWILVFWVLSVWSNGNLNFTTTLVLAIITMFPFMGDIIKITKALMKGGF
ncbi:MAG: hypothetical protein ACRC28_18425 [Clostridium sp.]|uniref:hypothetical protein n=1 Tax=Clostridium sp. TaxID=1506 RepID=UPI003F35B5F8